MIDVLIVDDDFMVARIHKTYVDEVSGFQVVGFARTGAEAVEMTADLQPHLVLLDIYLPDANGLDLLQPLRAAAPEVDVLVISAAREADSVRRALRSGITHYLIKPFTFEDLRDRLVQYRQTFNTLSSIEERPNQEDVDLVFGMHRSSAALPKGLSVETLRLVQERLRAVGHDVSAVEMAGTAGMSRGSARRYLEHLVDTGQAKVRLKYGEIGRPERRYLAK